MIAQIENVNNFIGNDKQKSFKNNRELNSKFCLRTSDLSFYIN